MSFKQFLVFILLFVSFTAKSELPQLSEQSKVVLLTCTPGYELYAGFGHSAIWVSDPSQGIDRLYNYGTFNFHTPHFYWKFIKGQLNYMITVTNVRRFINEYDYRKIGVTGQTLNLTTSEEQELYQLLEDNLLPQNRYYKYDFFFDNCATRIRDVVVKASDGNIDFNTPDSNLSFRQMLFPYLIHTPWTKFGINLILGLTADQIATPDQYMYLPKYMQNEFKTASVQTGTKTKKLVKSEHQYLKLKLDFQYNKLTAPSLLFSVLFLIIGLITLIEIRTKHYFKWLDIVLNSIGVLAGSFLFFMWVGTDHIVTNQNLNIFWLFPAQALFLLSFFFKKKHNFLVEISFGIIVAASIAMFFWPQAMETSFLIISLIYAFRYLFHSRLTSIDRS